jgi:hypothetical protein
VVRDPNNPDEVAVKKAAAIRMAEMSGPRIPLGVFYQVRLPTYSERLNEISPSFKDQIPAKLLIEDPEHRPTTDLSQLFAEIEV